MILSTYKNQINGTYKGENKICITTHDEIHLKFDCNIGSIVNGTRKPFLYTVGLDMGPGNRTNKKPKTQKVSV